MRGTRRSGRSPRSSTGTHCDSAAHADRHGSRLKSHGPFVAVEADLAAQVILNLTQASTWTATRSSIRRLQRRGFARQLARPGKLPLPAAADRGRFACRSLQGDRRHQRIDQEQEDADRPTGAKESAAQLINPVGADLSQVYQLGALTSSTTMTPWPSRPQGETFGRSSAARPLRRRDADLAFGAIAHPRAGATACR